jgi:hypothetical protein
MKAEAANAPYTRAMPSKKIAGLVLLVAGAVALYFGFQATETLTGDYSDQTMLYLIGGAIAAVAGLGLLVFTGKR